MTLLLLEPRVQHYAWGDRRFLPNLLGRDNPDGTPYAELWMGAHPDLPSRVEGTSLRELVDAEPEAFLGREVAATFGPELPFLLKVLSAAVPLSLQAHPDARQARAGFERENEAGIPVDARNRSYRDPRAKPELIVALTELYALVGFRPFEEIGAQLEEVPELHRFRDRYEPSAEGLRALYETILTLPAEEADRALEPILDRLKRKTFTRDRREHWMVRCDEVFARNGHHDRGVLVLLLLNLVTLKPGEGVFLAPGVLHSYLEGTGIEIMSSSNNVLRGGFTDKHVDLEELSRTVLFRGERPRILRPVAWSETEQGYETRAREFELSRIDVQADRSHESEGPYGPQILFAIAAQGPLEIRAGDETLALRRGQCAFVGHGTAYRVSGLGSLFVAGMPHPSPRFRGRRPKELRFGTSGLRGLVSEMTDLETYVNTRGFLEYLLGRQEIYRGDPVSLAGDLRPSSERILRSVSRAVEDTGFRVEYLGRIPTPALTRYGVARGRASIMVTGSHIPFDRNGIKFNRPSGEVMKSDEKGVLEAVTRVRVAEYGRTKNESPFGDDGMLREGTSREFPSVVDKGRESYVRRYLDFFPEEALTGKRVVVYQHSAVGRDLFVEILRGLGAEVLPMGREETFVPIDTEDISDDRLRELERLARVARDTLGAIDAIVSTDGDSDRPLVVGLEPDGSVRFLNGDLLGILVSDYLKADAIVVPVSVNDAVDLWCEKRGVRLEKTRIGSPYVIEGMNRLRSEGGAQRIAGFEANGGFLLGSDISRGGRTLAALLTRDAALPVLAVLHATVEKKRSLVDLLEELPARFGKSGLLDGIPIETSRAILGRFSSETGRRELSSYFRPEQGFGSVIGFDETDGLRIYFAGGDIAHIRPSGNAPQLRIYGVASSQERANEIVRLAVAEPDGILRRMAEQAVQPSRG